VTASPPVPGALAHALFWLRFGCLSFGGPAGQLALIERELIARRGWLSHEQFREGLAVATLLPGPEALKLVIYCGWSLRGNAGGVVAGLGFLLPAALLLGVLSWFYVSFGAVPRIAAAVEGLAAVVVALIGHALVRLLPRLLLQRWLVAVALAAVLALSLLRLQFLWVVAGALCAGASIAWLSHPGGERVFGRLHALAGVPARRTLAIAGAGAALWCAFAMAWWLIAGGAESRLGALYRELTVVSLLAFGGAYPALANANQIFGEGLGWLTARDAATGLALAESTPGPLVIVLQFYGYVAAWNAPAPLEPAVAAAWGALAASVAVFGPSFVLMLIAAPFVAALRRDARVFAAMSAVTAVTLAAIADLGLRFAVAVLWSGGEPQWPLLALAGLALAALLLGVEMHWIVLLGLTAGAALA
jgi:chromate transporter